MAAMRAPHSGNPRRMAGNRQPVMNGGSNSAAFQRRIAFAFMPGNQEQYAISRGDGPLQRPVDRLPRPVQRMAVQVEHAIGFQAAGAEPSVPASIERGLLKGFGPLPFDWPTVALSWAIHVGESSCVTTRSPDRSVIGAR